MVSKMVFILMAVFHLAIVHVTTDEIGTSPASPPDTPLDHTDPPPPSPPDTPLDPIDPPPPDNPPELIYDNKFLDNCSIEGHTCEGNLICSLYPNDNSSIQRCRRPTNQNCSFNNDCDSFSCLYNDTIGHKTCSDVVSDAPIEPVYLGGQCDQPNQNCFPTDKVFCRPNRLIRGPSIMQCLYYDGVPCTAHDECDSGHCNVDPLINSKPICLRV